MGKSSAPIPDEKNDNASSDDDDWSTGRTVQEDVNSPIVQECAKQAMRQYNKKCADENYWYIIEVLESKPYINVGFEHHLKIQFAKSTCLKKNLSPKQFEELAEEYTEIDEKERKILFATCRYCKSEATSNPCGSIHLFEKHDWD